MKDSYNRTIDYMRVSITDHCNLRCKYCMPYDPPFIPQGEILRYEEILRICRAAAETGIKHIKVTGGEPLVRQGCVKLIQELKTLPGIEHVTLSTNGVLLEQYLDALRALGIDGINISLDTLDPVTYCEVTGSSVLDRVWRSVQKALELGVRVKLNCVPLRGINDLGCLQVARLAERYPLDIRFIETMPIGYGNEFALVTGAELLESLRRVYHDLHEDGSKRGFGPARYYVSGSLKGSIGFIDAVSHCFCERCNRIRLTSEGFLKLCLNHDDGVDLKALVRGGADDAVLVHTIGEAIRAKPDRHRFYAEAPKPQVEMSRIGG